MYNFTTKWFNNTAKKNWDHLIPEIKPHKILEIGSFEGTSTCYLIEKLSGFQELEIHCIDTWEGSMEHIRDGLNMAAAEANFDNNIEYAMSKALHRPLVYKYKERSETGLMKLFLEGKQNYFDFVYVDGSHATADVISDAILSFKLLKVKGVMAFDDYAWAAGQKDLDYFPKIAIDAFTTIYGNKVQMVGTIITQVWIIKMAD